jgi:hypothetical protein
MSFTLVRYCIYREVGRELLQDTDVHAVMLQTLFCSEAVAQQFADILNESYLPAAGPWYVEEHFIVMTEAEHEEYAWRDNQ